MILTFSPVYFLGARSFVFSFIIIIIIFEAQAEIVINGKGTMILVLLIKSFWMHTYINC